MKTLLLAALLLLAAASAKAGTTLQVQDLAPAGQAFLSSQTFSAASSFALNLVVPAASTVDCDVYISSWNTSAGQANMTFNGDSAAHYNNSDGFYSQGVGATGVVNLAATAINLQRTPMLTAQFPAEIHFHYLSMAPQVMLNIDAAYVNSSSQWEHDFETANWSQGGPPKSATVTASAGTMTGIARCTYIAQ